MCLWGKRKWTCLKSTFQKLRRREHPQIILPSRVSQTAVVLVVRNQSVSPVTRNPSHPRPCLGAQPAEASCLPPLLTCAPRMEPWSSTKTFLGTAGPHPFPGGAGHCLCLTGVRDREEQCVQCGSKAWGSVWMGLLRTAQLPAWNYPRAPQTLPVMAPLRTVLTPGGPQHSTEGSCA